MLRSTLRLVFVSSALALLASCGSDSTSPRTQRTAISLDYCPGDAPVWAAYQDESGPWKHVAISGTTLSFTATGSRLGIAQVFVDGAQTYVAVRYLTPGDLAPVNGVACRPLAGRSSSLSPSPASRPAALRIPGLRWPWAARRSSPMKREHIS